MASGHDGHCLKRLGELEETLLVLASTPTHLERVDDTSG